METIKNEVFSKQIIIWLSASLIMPVLVALFRSDFGGLILLFWPGSIILMSLGAEEKPVIDVAYVWSLSILSNVVLYFLLGFSLTKAMSYFKQNK